MIPNDWSLPLIIPVLPNDGVSLVDSNLFQVVSLANSTCSKLTNAQLANRDILLRFPGLLKTFQYYFANNDWEGIPSALFGPVLIQLQPADQTAALLYLERSVGEGLLYTIVLKEFRIENGLPIFSNHNLDCIHYAQKEKIRMYFDRAPARPCMIASTIALSNAIFAIKNSRNKEWVDFLANKTKQVSEQRKKLTISPRDLLLAPFGKTADGKIFSLEPARNNNEIVAGWRREDFYNLLVNMRSYIPSLLEWTAKKAPVCSNSFINDSIGPLRIKLLNDRYAESLFMRVRSNALNGIEFWVGKSPYEGNAEMLRLDYEQLLVRKKRMASTEIIGWFPAIDSLNLLLPLFLQIDSVIHQSRFTDRGIQGIIVDRQRNPLLDTGFTVRDSVQIHRSQEEDLPDRYSGKEIRGTLPAIGYRSKETGRAANELRPCRNLGSTDDILFPGSREEFEWIQKERLRSLRAAEYKRRTISVNPKVV